MRSLFKPRLLLCLFLVSIFSTVCAQEKEMEIIVRETQEESNVDRELSDLINASIYIFKETIWRNKMCNTLDSLKLEVVNGEGDSVLNGTIFIPVESTLFCHTSEIKEAFANLMHSNNKDAFSAFGISQNAYVGASYLMDKPQFLSQLVEDSAHHFSTNYSRYGWAYQDHYGFDSILRLSILTSHMSNSTYGEMFSKSQFLYDGKNLVSEKLEVVEKYALSKDSSITKSNYVFNEGKLMQIDFERIPPRGAPIKFSTTYHYDELNRIKEVFNLWSTLGLVSCRYTYEKDRLIVRIEYQNNSSGLNDYKLIYHLPEVK